MTTIKIVLETTFSDPVPGDNQLKHTLKAEYYDDGQFKQFIYEKMDKDAVGWNHKTFWDGTKALKFFIKQVTTDIKSCYNYANLKILPGAMSQ